MPGRCTRWSRSASSRLSVPLGRPLAPRPPAEAGRAARPRAGGVGGDRGRTGGHLPGRASGGMEPARDDSALDRRSRGRSIPDPGGGPHPIRADRCRGIRRETRRAAPMRTIDLNADLGEGMPWDFELLAWISSANISCGAAGDPVAIAATLAEADRRGVVVGAPSVLARPRRFREAGAGGGRQGGRGDNRRTGSIPGRDRCDDPLSQASRGVLTRRCATTRHPDRSARD